MGALPAAKTPLFDIPHLVGISASEHLRHQAIIVASIVARIDTFKTVPMVGKDLFEDAPGWRSYCSHQAVSLRSVGLCVIALFYHIPPTTSTPSSALTGARSPTSLTLAPRGLQGNPQMQIPIRSRYSEEDKWFFYFAHLLNVGLSYTARDKD